MSCIHMITCIFWISNVIDCGFFMCSMVWGKRWLFVLLILVELLIITVMMFKLSFHNTCIYLIKIK